MEKSARAGAVVGTAGAGLHAQMMPSSTEVAPFLLSFFKHGSNALDRFFPSSLPYGTSLLHLLLEWKLTTNPVSFSTYMVRNSACSRMYYVERWSFSRRVEVRYQSSSQHAAERLDQISPARACSSTIGQCVHLHLDAVVDVPLFFPRPKSENLSFPDPDPNLLGAQPAHVIIRHRGQTVH